MTGIFNGLQDIINLFNTIVNFIINIINGILQMAIVIKETVTNTSNIILTLPSWLIGFASATLAICVIFQLVGRENGK